MKPTTTAPANIEILSVEDSETQRYLIARILKTSGMKFNITFANDGEDALLYLRREGKYSTVTRPHLVLLDINLPKMDGTEVLREIKNDAALRDIPMLMLTASESEEEKLKCHSLQADAFIPKPWDLEGYHAVLTMVEHVCRSLGRAQLETGCREGE